MKHLFQLAALFLICCTIVGCKPDEEKLGTIYGTVTDYTTGEPVGNANVTLSPDGTTTLTGSDGTFEFVDLQPGKYSLRISKDKYVDNDDDYVIELEAGKRVPRDVQLKRKIASLKITDMTGNPLDTLDFGAEESVKVMTFNVFNDGTDILKCNVTYECEWIANITGLENEIEVNQTVPVIVRIDRSALSNGINSTIIYITTSGSGSNQLVIKATSQGAAVIFTKEPIEVTSTSATVGGNITDDGGRPILSRGVCYGTSQSPDINGDHTEDGSGIGEFSHNITGLSASTKYYARAYATNRSGTYYASNIVSFTTHSGQAEVVTHDATNVTETSAILGGEVLGDGGYPVTLRGVCYATHQNTTLNDIVKSGGEGIGVFSCDLSNLTTGTKYYFRAFAINAMDTVFGVEKNFVAVNGMPTVNTLNVTDVQPTSAIGGGVVTDDGGHNVTERGVCWSTSHNPNPENNAHAANGSGDGSFTVPMTSLTPSTKYYVRAYAKNSEGTSLGAEVEFTTLGISTPSVTTQPITEITRTTALGGGIVTSDGGAAISERGICWSTSHNPTVSGSHATNGLGEGSYSVSMTGLTPNTTYYVKAYAINSQGVGYGEEKTFKTANISSPVVTTNEVTSITQTTATCGGNVTDEGGGTVTERGICWSISENPTINDSHSSSGTGTGIYSITMTGLVPGTTYHVRAYAKNTTDIGYGTDVTFTTSPIQKPTVTTNTISSITHTTATGGGNVTADGGAPVTERGICWGTSPNPTVSGSHAHNGMGSGSFSVNMTGLTPGTAYYVRAYAKNSEKTGYGQDVVFTTLPIGEPTVTTSAVTDITQHTATCGGNVTADGGSTVTERGLCWSTNPNPTISNSHQSSGGGTGQFTLQLTNLAGNTTYHVRAYAKNNEKTGYGDDVTFNTLAPPPPTGAISGLFTINNSGDQVYFSQGNLQYQASTDTWRFAENQWDFVGGGNENISSTYYGWIDLFGWGTSGYDHGATCYQPWSTSTYDYNYYAYANPNFNLYDGSGQADWGYNAISNGGNQENLWRTLTASEWEYILNTRPGCRYAMASITGIGSGLILLPDDWDESIYPLFDVNQTGYCSFNNINAQGWSTYFEPYGVVFLCYTGYREGTSFTFSSNTYIAGYWSSDSGIVFGFNGPNHNGYPYFDPHQQGGANHIGHSVRLVQDYSRH